MPAMINPLDAPMKEFTVNRLLDSGVVTVRHVDCRGTCRHRSAEECASHTHFVFPYRGVYLRHVGTDLAVADANHVLFFNQGQGYQVSHPVTGGDASLVLTLVSRSVGPRTAREPGASHARRRLVDRVKVLLAGDLSRRWTLADIATEMKGSPVYLTQVFQQVEGLPLYRYHLRLRLARALDLIAGREDLSGLAQDLGFSSHSHFSAAFRQHYGVTPGEFRHNAAPVSPSG